MRHVVAVIADFAFVFNRGDYALLCQQRKVPVDGGQADAVAFQVPMDVLGGGMVAAVQHVVHDGALLARHPSPGGDAVGVLINRHDSSLKIGQRS